MLQCPPKSLSYLHKHCFSKTDHQKYKNSPDIILVIFESLELSDDRNYVSCLLSFQTKYYLIIKLSLESNSIGAISTFKLLFLLRDLLIITKLFF